MALKVYLDESGVLTNFGQMLDRARRDAGLGVRELARLAGVNAGYISRIERGQTIPRSWTKIAAIVRHLPSSELARVVQTAGVQKHLFVEGQADLLMMAAFLPSSVYEDRIWLDTVVNQTQSLLAILESKQRATPASADGPKRIKRSQEVGQATRRAAR